MPRKVVSPVTLTLLFLSGCWCMTMDVVDRDNYNEWALFQFCDNAKSKTITRAKLDVIIQYIKQGENCEDAALQMLNNDKIALSKWKNRINKKQYKVTVQDGEEFLEAPQQDLVAVEGSRNKVKQGPVIYVKVVAIEDFYSVIEQAHAETGHGGQHATIHKLKHTHGGIPQLAVKQFIARCSICQQKAPQISRPPPRAIVVEGFLRQCQIDLVDMHPNYSVEYPDPDRCPELHIEYRYIGHFMDHYSKYHCLFPLERKTQVEVHKGLRTIFSYLGLPKILQSDRGSEFGRLKEFVKDYSGTCTVITSSAYHPQSQGLVERGNRTLKNKLSARAVQEGGLGNWHTWLPDIQLQLNTTLARGIGMTPYECVFGIKPSHVNEVEDEEDEEPDISSNFGLAGGVRQEAGEEVLNEPDISSNFGLAGGLRQEAGEEVLNEPDISSNFGLAGGVRQEAGEEVLNESDISNENQPARQEHLSQEVLGVVVDITIQANKRRRLQSAVSPEENRSVYEPDISSNFGLAGGVRQEAGEEVLNEPDISNQNEPASDVVWERGEGLQDDHRYSAASTGTTKRHEKVRSVAHSNYLKSAVVRVAPRKSIRVCHYAIGDRVTVAVPARDRHRLDPKRIHGVVVSIHGPQHHTYSIRCSKGVIQRVSPIYLEKVCGPSLIKVDGWEKEPLLTVKTAARMISMSRQKPARCACQGKCMTLKCQCKEAGSTCTSACHKGRHNQCQNKPTPGLETDTSEAVSCDVLADNESTALGSQPNDEDASPEPTAVNEVSPKPLCQLAVDEVIESFAEFKINKLLEGFAAITDPWLLEREMRLACRQVLDHFPAISEEPNMPFNSQALAQYGDGYIVYVPEKFRESHVPYQAPADNNRCMYASVSLALYGTFQFTAALKLGALAEGVLKTEKFVEKISSGIDTIDELAIWISKVRSAVGYQDILTLESKKDIVRRHFLAEVFTLREERDAGPLQLEMLASHIGREIHVHQSGIGDVEEHLKIYGMPSKEHKPVLLLLVPLHLPHSADGNTRLTHFVPLVPKSREERVEYREVCVAESRQFCNRREIEGWVQCNTCKRWLHDACIGDKASTHYEGKEFDCGCHKLVPFKPRETFFYRSSNRVIKFLDSNKNYIKDIIVAIMSKKMPSWRMSYCSGKNWVSKNILAQEVVPLILAKEDDRVTMAMMTAVRRWCRNMLPGPTAQEKIDRVVVPEVVIRMIMLKEGATKLEAEHIMKDAWLGIPSTSTAKLTTLILDI